MKAWIWEHLADPILHRIAARIEHLNARKPHMHDGASWRPIATLGRGVSIHRDASLTSPGVAGSLQVGDFCHIHEIHLIFRQQSVVAKVHRGA